METQCLRLWVSMRCLTCLNKGQCKKKQNSLTPEEKQKHIKNTIFAFGLFVPGANLYVTLSLCACVFVATLSIIDSFTPVKCANGQPLVSR